MRGTLDWSYELCSEVEQTVFDRLSVFFPRGSISPPPTQSPVGTG